MSHIAKIKVKIKDLQALREAAEQLGLKFMEGQRTYRWFGEFVGDSPLPEGISEDELGTCDHALVTGNSGAYEIGVKRMPDGSYTLLWDFWMGGYGLRDCIGQDGGKLIQGYTVAAAIRAGQKQGLRATKTVGARGEVVLTFNK